MRTRKYGELRRCGRCGSLVEWHGKVPGWINQAGNTTCYTHPDNGQLPRTLKPHSVES